MKTDDIYDLLIWYDEKWQPLYFMDERSRDIVVKIMNERKGGLHYEIIKEDMRRAANQN